ncbi:nitrogenase component 1 [Desulfovibrio ferrophilus]|uniref:Nitrogenase n=1 Tax=Desulfovibrio ferrophilus TaxID=241368 RepID=A0A2Z6AY90_9BACT|nr:nitrogenase component 1 [Desulfovibrio ferrophilus]BBD08209.1 nitrogenase [Desulfovibrio ferrophilus]
MIATAPKTNYVSTTNACKLCTPLGATLAFKGVAGGVPFLHGSQGCATYMRRYIISHFREPMDIASSALGEKNAIYGGGPNLKKGLINVMRKYAPEVIGVATTCLTETIGDDVHMILHEFRQEFGDLPLPAVVQVSTPSFSGTHMDGFHGAVLSLAEQLCVDQVEPTGRVNVMSGFVSAEDLRHMREIGRAFDLELTLLPDYSDTLDGPTYDEYQPIAAGGTTLEEIRSMSGARASLEFGTSLVGRKTAGASLEKRFGVVNHQLPMPIGLRATDALMETLSELTGQPIPEAIAAERGRLLDALVDGHKYIAGQRAVVYGDEDMVLGMTSLLAEIGIRPVLVATGAGGGGFAEAVHETCAGLLPEMPEVMEKVDFHDIAARAGELKPDLLVGNSKGYRYARDWNADLLRVGFPIHDRFGGQRLLHLGYRGALGLFDSLVNLAIERKQNTSDIGYGYI